MIESKNKVGWALAALSALAVVGCGGEPAAGSASSDLHATDALGTLDAGQWTSAEPGCEGHLDGDVRFAIASADDGLVAALDTHGEIVCVDTVAAVEEELDESGREEEADQLVHAFAASVARTGDTTTPSFDGPNREGDPQPEPNIQYERFRMEGDPQPEPNMGS